MKYKYKKAYMDMAIAFGQSSEAKRLKVGCLIADESGIISEGCNGMPPKWHTEECEDKLYANIVDADLYSEEEFKQQFPFEDCKGFYKLVTKPECRHAEVAALEKLWNKPNTAKGAYMFVSHAPCKACAIKIVGAGISEVYFREPYRNGDGLLYLQQHGVEIGMI